MTRAFGIVGTTLKLKSRLARLLPGSGRASLM